MHRQAQGNGVHALQQRVVRFAERGARFAERSRLFAQWSLLFALFGGCSADATLPFAARPEQGAPADAEGSAAESTLGSVTLRLRLPGDVYLASVTATLRGPGGLEEVRSIEVPGDDSVLSISFNGLPAGGGYSIFLTAPGCTSSTETFAVSAGQFADVEVTLSCGEATVPTGGVNVTARVEPSTQCAILDRMVVAPSVQDLSGGIASHIELSFKSGFNLGNTVVTWGAAAGLQVIRETAATFLCDHAGAIALSVVASSSAGGQRCTHTMTSVVQCLEVARCGNGVIEADERCEPPGMGFCDANCQEPLVCGDGFINAPYEQCEPPNTLSCDGSCQEIPPFGNCGDGIVNSVFEQCEPPGTPICDFNCQVVFDPGFCGDGVLNPQLEQCEPPNTPTCDSACQEIFQPGFCGDGLVDSPFEQCEPPGVAFCDPTCQLTSACGDGILNQPFEQCEPPNTAFCDSTCQALVQPNTCGDGTGDPVDPGAQCDAGTAEGSGSSTSNEDSPAASTAP
jgi:hypothetical protein